MKSVFVKALNNKHIVLQNGEGKNQVEALYYLASRFGVIITKGEEFANIELVDQIATVLGNVVPDPFYRGFPESVHKLSKAEVVLDQLLHYAQTYGLGNFDEAGHSLFEPEVKRLAMKEKTEPIPFKIVSEDEAWYEVEVIINNLCASTRPLNADNRELLIAWIKEDKATLPTIASKTARIELSAEFRKNIGLTIFDILDLADELNVKQNGIYTGYCPPRKTSLKKLHLNSANRRFLVNMLNEVLNKPLSLHETKLLVEKKKFWKGLLHHIHYRPKTNAQKCFVSLMYDDFVKSYNSDMMRQLANNNTFAAAELAAKKGSANLLRNLVFLLSRAKTDEDAAAILSRVEAKSPVVLFQILTNLNLDNDGSDARTFRWVKHNLTSTHTETLDELGRRKSILPAARAKAVREHIEQKVREYLAQGGDANLKVYVDETMKNIALPLQEGSSSSGFNTLPRGSRIPLNGKQLRAFTYWEKVNDIDLAMKVVHTNGNVEHIGWYAWSNDEKQGYSFSGDETSGYNGGAEYFDINIEQFKKNRPTAKYIIFTDNVYSSEHFCNVVCRAGFMLRENLKRGAIFEPKTVKTSWTISADSREAYLFALDLETYEMIWLNTAIQTERSVNTGDAKVIMSVMDATKKFNVYDLYTTRYTNRVETPTEADLIVSDQVLELRPEQTQIHSYDIDALLAEINK